MGNEMTTDARTLLGSALRERASFIELLVVAVLLALAINLLAGALPNLLAWPSAGMASLSAILGIVAIALLFRRVYSQLAYRRVFDGFFVYDMRDHHIINVPRYDFAEELYSYFRGAFSENPALKSLWDKNPFKPQASDLSSFLETKPFATALITEALEYFVIHHLSVHMMDYFNTRGLEKKLQIFQRHHVPEVLLNNRFMDLFTRPLEERVPFGGIDTAAFGPRFGPTVAARGYGGAIYDRFELVLPAGSVVARAPGAILITTKRLKLELRPIFQGSVINPPKDFEKRYLHVDAPTDVFAYSVSVDIRAAFKPLSVLSRSGWDYYYWVDSFLDSFDKQFSADSFFSRINWELALTVAEVLQHDSKSHAQSPEHPNAQSHPQ